MIDRIVTRPDFDGVVCAVLLQEALGGSLPILWVQPNEIQKGLVTLTPGDVVANLPLNGPCGLWFDHHISNDADLPYEGLFRIAPSAAGLIYEYYKDHFGTAFKELVQQTDRIDSAQLSLDQILRPQDYSYILLSMTVFRNKDSDLSYCNHLVDLLRKSGIDQVMADSQVAVRCREVLEANRNYEIFLRRHTVMRGHVSVTDFRGIRPAPEGNRFLVYSLFPEAVVNLKIYDEGENTAIKLGHSI
ncbi:MAG: exopolyphosphatase, partial [Desulfosarcinaceae bacterium]